MTTTSTSAPVLDDAAAQALSERLADFFRTAELGDVFTDDVFLDGHPPFWRFQVEGRDALREWYRSYAPEGVETTVVSVIPTAVGFVTEYVGRHTEDGELMTDRKVLVCEVRGQQVSALTVYCSGDWNAELRDRHSAETTLLRPEPSAKVSTSSGAGGAPPSATSLVSGGGV